MEQLADTVMYLEADEQVEGVWNVWRRDPGRKFEPKGFVFQESNGIWSSSRHTYTGVPARHGTHFTTKGGAASSLMWAQPFHGKEFDHPSLEVDEHGAPYDE